MSELIEEALLQTAPKSLLICDRHRPDNDEDGDDDDGHHDPQFKPLVELPEVEVLTNEEQENVLIKIRAKLYRFDSRCEPSEWKERGTGELKILHHKENNSCRVVMRRDKTFKVCANHFITPWMGLKACGGSDRAFLYSVAADFADEEAKAECLAIKFGNVENAKLFESKFEEAKNIVLTKCPLYNGEEQDSDGDDSECEKNDDEKDLVTQKFSELNVDVDINSK